MHSGSTLSQSGALEDFSKHKDNTSKQASKSDGGEAGSSEQHDDPPTEQLWNEEFMEYRYRFQPILMTREYGKRFDSLLISG